MRTGQNKQRNRNRPRTTSGGGGGGNGGGNPLSRIYESNGPDVKVRGTAQTVAEKYLQLARDAQVSGDYVMGESYFQFAEHYLRIVSAAQAYNQQLQPQFRRPDDDMDGDDDDGSDTTPQDPRLAAQPVIEQPVMEQPRDVRDGDTERPYQPQQQQPYRQPRNDFREPREQSGNREPNSQPYNNRERPNKPRWQERRDRDGNAPQPVQQTRPVEEQPREQPREQPAPPPAPVVIESAAETQWEAPSFLRRPAVVPQPAAELEAAPEAAAVAPATRKYVRKPRKEVAAEPAEAAATEAPPIAD